MYNHLIMFERYSIWALPEQSTEEELRAIILLLSQLYSGPHFEPHMTLLGDIKAEPNRLVDIVDELAENIDELKLNLGEISFSTTFFQSVFVRVLVTAQLMEQNLRAKRLLRLENNLFMPHVSLLYGDHDMQTREQAVSQVVLPNKTYNATRLALVPSTTNPAEWDILHQAKIGP